MKLSTQTLTLILLTLTPALTLAIPQHRSSNSEEICISSTDCYTKDFLPTKQWQIIREGQVLPQGLDVQLDWQTGEKRARLPEEVDSIEELNILLGQLSRDEEGYGKELIMKEPVKEDESKKIVSYNTEEDDDEDEIDSDIMALKQAAQGSASVIDLNEALAFLKHGDMKDDAKLSIALESLNEYSHSLKDGMRISLEENFKPLLNLGLKDGNYHERELALRVIAQSLRHNLKAVENIDGNEVLHKVLNSLDSETNSVIQKRLLGVVSSVLQTKENVQEFIKLQGAKQLLKDFRNLQEDSKIRTLEILEDVEKYQNDATKRELDKESGLLLYKTLEDSLSNNTITEPSNLHRAFSKLSELKKSHPDYKPSTKFMKWLTNEIQRQSLQKRDGGEDYDENLHTKLSEDRHLVFGNPNAMRKAFDEF